MINKMMYTNKLKNKTNKMHIRQQKKKPFLKICTFSSIEDADTPISTIIYFVPPECWITIRFDPNSCHGIVEDFILFQDTQSPIVHKHTPVLPSPNFVATDDGIAASPVKQNQKNLVFF